MTEVNTDIDEILNQEINEFPFAVSIRDKVFKFRSWKIKDKKNYLSCKSRIRDDLEDNEKVSLVEELRKVLVLNCIEGDEPITPDEYQFLLVAIRCESINHKIELTLECDKCGEEFEFDLNLKSAIKTDVEKFKTIIVDVPKGTLKFKMGRVGSQSVYDDFMSKSESQFEALYVDFVQHVHSINGKVYSSEDKFKMFNSIDVQVFEDIIKQWEPQRFKIDNVIGVVCTHCNHVDEVIVDDIPGFFPLSWTE